MPCRLPCIQDSLLRRIFPKILGFRENSVLNFGYTYTQLVTTSTNLSEGIQGEYFYGNLLELSTNNPQEMDH